jgi:hypothetical protein
VPGLSRIETASAATPRKGRRMTSILDVVLRPSKMATPALLGFPKIRLENQKKLMP